MAQRLGSLRVPGICALLVILTYLVYTADFGTVALWPGSQTSAVSGASLISNAKHENSKPYNKQLPTEPHKSLTAKPHKAPPAKPQKSLPDEASKSSSSFPFDETSEDSTTPAEDLGYISFPPGVLLGAEVRREIASPDRSYLFELEDDGNIALYRNISWDGGNNKHLMWSFGTGNIEKNVENIMRLSDDGTVSVIGLIKHEVNHVDERLLWHSNLLPDCKAPKNPPAPDSVPSFNITSKGEIIINGRCKLFTPPAQSAGKLALLVSGLYRTNRMTCKSHVDYIAKNPAAESVDIFVYVLYEDWDAHDGESAKKLEDEIRACYGPNLRTLTVKSVPEVSEQYPGAIPSRCGQKLNRLQSQLKTLHLGGMEWWNWSVKKGVKHDTVLRIRTDHEFFGDTLPKFKPLDQLKGNELVMPPIVAGGSGAPFPRFRHWFCSNPFGGMDVGMCFSSPISMEGFC